jgi:hypothetical protein
MGTFMFQKLIKLQLIKRGIKANSLMPLLLVLCDWREAKQHPKLVDLINKQIGHTYCV